MVPWYANAFSVSRASVCFFLTIGALKCTLFSCLLKMLFALPRNFQVSLPTLRTLSHKSPFIPRTCNLWNVLPSSCFPESYNLPSFKSKINKLDLISLSLLLAFRFLLCSFVGALYRPPWPFLNITH